MFRNNFSKITTCDFERILIKQCKYNIWYNKVYKKNLRQKFYGFYTVYYTVSYTIIFFNTPLILLFYTINFINL